MGKRGSKQDSIVRPRYAWRLHNAFTDVAKDMAMPTRLPAILAVGKFFGMSSGETSGAEPSTPPIRLLGEPAA